MKYSIKAVAAKTGLAISTLRFYDKAGLLPFVARNAAGYRQFTDGDLLLLHTICALKATDMPLAMIRRYVELVMQGPTTVPQRAELLAAHRTAVVAKQAELAANLAEVDRKLAIYQAPDAVAQVGAEWAAASADKRANDLPNPFAAKNSERQI